jgi:hypothetical protein
MACSGTALLYFYLQCECVLVGRFWKLYTGLEVGGEWGEMNLIDEVEEQAAI